MHQGFGPEARIPWWLLLHVLLQYISTRIRSSTVTSKITSNAGAVFFKLYPAPWPSKTKIYIPKMLDMFFLGDLGSCYKSFFKKMGHLRPLFIYLHLFKQTLHFFTTNKCEKYPSSIWCRDSNQWPLEHESPPITTRPGLPPVTRVVAAAVLDTPLVSLFHEKVNCNSQQFVKNQIIRLLKFWDIFWLKRNSISFQIFNDALYLRR